MYRYLILLLIISVSSCKQSKPELKENIIKWENGKIKRKHYTSDNMIQDTMWDYYSSGALSKIRLFKDDKQNGRSLYFYETGQLSEVQYYQNGKQTEVDSVFFPSGKVKLIAEFKNGMRNGYFKTYNENGILERENHYRNDTLLIANDSIPNFSK